MYYKLKKGVKIIAEGVYLTAILDDTISFEEIKTNDKSRRFFSPISPHPLASCGFDQELFDFGQLSFDYF